MKRLLMLFIIMGILSSCIVQSSFASGNTFVISTVEELFSFADKVNKGNDFSGDMVILNNDIILNKRVVDADGNLNEGEFTTWTPIGNGDNPFRGIFDGNGCTISGIYINDDGQYKGLFGVLSGAQVYNVYVEDSYISANDHAGAVAGYAIDKSTIASCHNVNTSIFTKNRSGGIVGWTDDSYVYNCSNAGYCFSNRCSGGIVGDVYSGGKLYNCENIGTVEGNELVGGISGGTTSADIQNCFNAGKVSRGYHIAGGGGSRSIKNCFAYKTDEFNANISGQAILFSDVSALLSEPVEINGEVYTKVVDALNAYLLVMETETTLTGWSQYDSFPFINRTNLKTSFGSTASGWSQTELESAYTYNLIPENLVGEDLTKPITRLEFAAVSVKVYENISGVSALPALVNPFEDCNDIEMLKAYNVGITNGMSKNEFVPDGLLNREQAATMLTRVFKRSTMPGWTMENDADYPLTFTPGQSFADDSLISDWAKESVYFMNSNKIILGFENNCFAPKNITADDEAIGYANATREQALIIAVRMVNNLK